MFWPWAKKRNANSKKQNSNPSATIKWYYLDSNKTKRGPLSTHAIQDLLKSQYIKLDSYVWNTEMCTWKRACQVAPLQKVILRTQAARERETKYVVVFVLLEHLFTSFTHSTQIQSSTTESILKSCCCECCKGQSHVVLSRSLETTARSGLHNNTDLTRFERCVEEENLRMEERIFEMETFERDTRTLSRYSKNLQHYESTR